MAGKQPTQDFQIHWFDHVFIKTNRAAVGPVLQGVVACHRYQQRISENPGMARSLGKCIGIGMRCKIGYNPQPDSLYQFPPAFRGTGVGRAPGTGAGAAPGTGVGKAFGTGTGAIPDELPEAGTLPAELSPPGGKTTMRSANTPSPRWL